MEVLGNNNNYFSWDYTDMKGISPNLCTHNSYLKKGFWPIRQPHTWINLSLKDIGKEELQKLLNANFIYHISDSKWIYPLVIVPKKSGKWGICIDYNESYKDTLKYYFPLPFIDQVLDTLAGNIFFSS